MQNRAEIIGMMLAAFPASGSQGDLAAMAYLLAVDGLSDYSIARSALEFIKGTAPGHDRRFAPSAALFADRCRSHEEAIVAGVRLIERNPLQVSEILAGPYFDDAGRNEIHSRLTALPADKRKLIVGLGN
jgi:hypothetical protein